MRHRLFAILFLLAAFCSACTNEYPPVETFRSCVGSTGYVSHFGKGDLNEWLAIPALAYNAKTQKMDSSTYVALFSEKIKYNEAQLHEIKAIPVSKDNQEMVNTAISLYQYVIAHQKKEYLQIAQMRDRHAPQDSLNMAIERFDNQCYNPFLERYNALWGYATQFAERHEISLDANFKKQ